MTRRTEHRPVPRVEYRGLRIGPGVRPVVEVVRVYEVADTLDGSTVGDGYAWGDHHAGEGQEGILEAAARRALAMALLLDLTNNPVLADDLAADLADQVLITLPESGWTLKADQLLAEVEYLLLVRQLGERLTTAKLAVRALLEESGQEAKRRRLEQMAMAAPPLYVHTSYRDEPAAAEPVAAGDEDLNVIDLDAPGSQPADAGEEPVSEEDRRQLVADPYRDDPEIPF